jgi:hypothetical protein
MFPSSHNVAGASTPAATNEAKMALRMQTTYNRRCRTARSMSFVDDPLKPSGPKYEPR